jgi:hypothetical protein
MVKHVPRWVSPRAKNFAAADERKVDVSGAASAPLQNHSSQPIDIFGGPGRTRTCNQTVMSGRL